MARPSQPECQLSYLQNERRLHAGLQFKYSE